MRNGYVDLCLQVQAVRREFEAVRTPLAAAIGVAASVYTHQIANVQRVLTDVRVRHLLADEVGLGKTVQALMVINSLRNQRRDLRALIVVPDQLVVQWRDEIMTRAHIAPLEEPGEAKPDQYIRLAWEAQLSLSDSEGIAKFTLAEIDPERFDVIVVDELHRLRADVQDRIVRVAARFEHVLVLTATPAFRHVKRHAQIFALLEPERVALVRVHIADGVRGVEEGLRASDDLSKWPDWAAHEIVHKFIEEDRTAASATDLSGLGTAALTHCAYRRVIRTRRADYAGVIPRRKHRPLVVEPLGAEVQRQSLMWQYFGHLDTLSREFDPVRLAKRVVLSPPSLEQRVDFLRRQGHERAGLLERVKPLVHRSQGDSRADALVDLLARIWTEDPSQRVLVAAQDNLTVDYLFDLVEARLSLIGPVLQRIPLVAARVRQGMMTEAVEDLGGFGNETNENLDAFQRGEAQVLFAPEVAQVGLNLQCARVLVLYSVPWRPEEVEQWIGRLDRIGNIAAFSSEGSAKTIDVYTIAQRGLVDEKVVNLLHRFQVFEKSVNLDGEHLDKVASLIEDAALRPDRIDWQELADDTEEMAADDEVYEFGSALRKHLPWSVHAANEIRQRLESIPAALPVLVTLPEHVSGGPRAWDRAIDGMLNLLQRAGDYHIRWNQDPVLGSRFRSLWYQFGEKGMYGRRDVLSKVVFSFGADPAHETKPQNAHAFINRRKDISNPPQRNVTMDLDGLHVRRQLRFLNFGDALHDELIEGWLPHGDDLLLLEVSFVDNHDIWKFGAPGPYLLRLSILDPADVLMARDLENRTISALTPPLSLLDPVRIAELERSVRKSIRCALEADVRWLRTQLTAWMNLDVRRHVKGRWVPVKAEEAAALLNPMAHEQSGVPPARGLRLGDAGKKSTEVELAKQRQADATASRATWGQRFPAFQEALAIRIKVVEEERRQAISLAAEELRESERQFVAAKERGIRASITRAQQARNAVEAYVQTASDFWDERVRWLYECKEQIRCVIPRDKLTALLQVREIQ